MMLGGMTIKMIHLPLVHIPLDTILITPVFLPHLLMELRIRNGTSQSLQHVMEKAN